MNNGNKSNNDNISDIVVSDEYRAKLASSREYQDFVAFKLYQLGIPLVSFGSYKYQNNNGENMLGLEIKNDKLFASTGNLYIETGERQGSAESSGGYVASGIMRQDNTWLYLIGDNNIAYIFGKKHLLYIMDNKSDNIVNVKTNTSIGFLLPIVKAENYCIRKIDFNSK